MSELFELVQGPAAWAVKSGLTEREIVLLGEGASGLTGTDGESYCYYADSGSALEDVDETQWRRAHSLLRFATREDRQAYLESRDWWQWARERGPVVPDESSAGGLPALFELKLSAGLTGSSAEGTFGGKDGKRLGVYSASFNGADPVTRDLRLSGVDWGRFEAELFYLNVRSWRDYETRSLDGLSWSLEYKNLARTLASGSNAYPPDGADAPTPEFGRMVLAVERLMGASFWPGFVTRAALDAIPDERDRVEHALLAAMRAWAEETASHGTDPAALTEGVFEKELVAHLGQLVDARRQVRLRPTATQPAALSDWPGVGDLDVKVDLPGGAAWVELKWAKSADTLHNCLWDAAKLASALREGRARHGYLLAGVPVSEFKRAGRRPRLFGRHVRGGSSLVDDHKSWWAAWEQENSRTYPASIPTPIVTTPVGGTRLDVEGYEPWLLILVRVFAPGTDRFPASTAT
jgi:hypothetical protein